MATDVCYAWLDPREVGMTTNANNRPEGNRLTTEVREGHAFLAKGRAEPGARASRPQQRVCKV